MSYNAIKYILRANLDSLSQNTAPDYMRQQKQI